MHKNCASFVQQGTLMVFQFQFTIPVLIFVPSSLPRKFDNARMPGVHGFYAGYGVRAARIDRSRDSFPRRWEKARGNDIWKNGRPRNRAKSIAAFQCLSAFIVGHISSCLYHGCGISKLCVFSFSPGRVDFAPDSRARNRELDP